MTSSNPFTPPQSRVADLADGCADIDRLPVSEAWKKRFRAMQKAGGPSMPNLKSMPKEERKGVSMFNGFAFLFGPIYYAVKGMWRKGIVLFLICVVVVLILELALAKMGFGKLGSAVTFGTAAVYATRANIDYYKKMVLGDNGWW